jgi:NADH-quinone oxidoreductase subunit M
MIAPSFPVLSCLWIWPLCVACVMACLPARRLVWWGVTGVGHMVLAVLAGGLACAFDQARPGLQFQEHLPLMPEWFVHYTLGVDGLSLPFVLLTVLMFPCVLAVLPEGDSKERRRAGVLLWITEGACLGAFVFQNLFLFAIAFEGVLVPVALIIHLWGGEHRVRAARTFFLYTLAGSLVMLLALVWCAETARTGTMTGIHLDTMAPEQQRWLWLALFLALAVKIPLVPFHTWLPLAHVEAPAAGSVILAALMLKMGGYGLVRLPWTLCPEATVYFRPLVCTMALASLLYGSWVAFAQTDLKKLIAWSSVAHMGYAVLGLATGCPAGIQGALFQMVSHGLVSGGLFVATGILYQRFHRRDLAFYGGLQGVMPRFSGVLILLFLASMALPGTSGFVGECLVLVGTARVWGLPLTLLAACGMVGSALYGLKAVHHLCLGPVPSGLGHAAAGMRPLTRGETLVLALLGSAVLGLGLFPGVLLQIIRPAVEVLARGGAS